ncbi:MAG: heparan-alpha-glucosaminide N-acetyltransferase [Pseudomonadota bacterium]
MNQVPRIEFLDWARGVALVAMTIFHFAFDLELLGFQEPGFISQPHWKYFARAIASSFLLLAGFSLFLAHFAGVRWEAWRWRMIKIVAAAVLITIATWFTTPQQFIFFGILHAIAFASIAGLMFLRFNAWLIAALAVTVFTIGRIYESVLFDHWIWWWTGLSQTTIISSDYVPVFPWFSAPLLGIAAAKLAMQHGWLDPLSKPKFNSRLSRLLKFLGRNSLVYYLLHQPILMGILFGILYLSG